MTGWSLAEERNSLGFTRVPLFPDPQKTLMRSDASAKQIGRLLDEGARRAQEAAGTVLDDDMVRPVYLIDVYQYSLPPTVGASGDKAKKPSRAARKEGRRLLLFAEALLESLHASDKLRAVLRFDGETLEELVAVAPTAIERLKEALASGRLEIAGAAYSRPAGAASSGESQVRRFLYGFSALRDALGLSATSYIVSEGQAFPQLPQLAKGFGIQRIVVSMTARPESDGTAELHSPLLLRGPDGSHIAAAFAPCVEAAVPPSRKTKAQDHTDPLWWSNDRLEHFRQETAPTGNPLLCRVQNVGGWKGPSASWSAVAARSDIRFVTPREYFDSVEPLVTVQDVPPAEGRWEMSGRRQRDLVDTEMALLLAERLDALAYAMGRGSDEKWLEQGWKDLLRAQGGEADVGVPLRAARSTAEWAAKYLAAYVDSSSVEGRGLVIFNPSSWPREEYMEVKLGGEAYRIFHAGREVPSQVVERHKGFVTLGFVAPVPALGYRLLEVRPGSPYDSQPKARKATLDSRYFTNAFYSAEIGDGGGVSVDVAGERLAAAAAYLTVWRKGRFYDSRDSVKSIIAHRQGPVFDRYLVEGRIAGMRFRQRLTFYRALSRVDLRTEVAFGKKASFGPEFRDGGLPAGEEAKMLSLNVRSPLQRFFADSSFLLSDVAGPRALALSVAGLDDERERGVALLNRGARSHCFDAEDGVMRNALAWAPKSSSFDGRVSGTGVWELALLPFTSRLEALQSGIDYQLPCLGAFVTPHPGRIPPEGSFLNIAPQETLLSAMFVREGSVFVRLWNASSRTAAASVDSGAPLALQHCALNLRDESSSEGLPLRPWGLQTVRLKGSGET